MVAQHYAQHQVGRVLLDPPGARPYWTRRCRVRVRKESSSKTADDALSDTSSLVKLYVDEAGSNAVAALVDGAA